MLVTLALLTALAPSPQHTAGAPPPIDPAGFGVDLDLHGATLLRYSWDGDAPVPFLRSVPRVHIDYGERGSGPRTRLYFAGNALVEAHETGARILESIGLEPSDGRVGYGGRLEPASRLIVALPRPSPGSYGWSLSFWLRPDVEAVGRTFLELGDAAELKLTSDRRLRVALVEPQAENLTSEGPLELGRWTRVSLSYDATLVRAVRLHVDGASVGRTLADGSPARVPHWLVLGDVEGRGDGFHGRIDELRLEDDPVTTQRALEEDVVEPAPGPHALTVHTTLGQATFSPWASPQRDALIDTPEELALGRLDGVALDGDWLRWAPARWERLTLDVAPPPRTTSPLADLGHGRLLVFGGETRDSHLWGGGNTADTWLLDSGARSWRRVAIDHGPSPRCHVPAAYSPDHDLVLLVGGWRNDVEPQEFHSDTWVFHPSQERWEERHPGGARVGTRSDHVLLYHPVARRFLLLQGRAVLLYDPVADVWEERPAPRAFDARGRPTTYVVAGSTAAAFDPGSGAVLLFGGEFGGDGGLEYRDTTALYDLASNAFTVLDPPLRPPARARTALARDPESGLFVLFGGVRDQNSQRFDDLWTFDAHARTWTRRAASNAPSARGGYYGMGYDDVGQRFLLPMGRHSRDRWLDETVALRIAPSRPGIAAFCFDRAGFGERTRWAPDVDAPGDSSVAFLFRTSASGLQWSRWTRRAPGFARVRFVQVLAVLEPGSSGEVPSVRRLGFE